MGATGNTFQSNQVIGIASENFSFASHVYSSTYSKQIMGTTGTAQGFYLSPTGTFISFGAIS